jgi:hypothetical protein
LRTIENGDFDHSAPAARMPLRLGFDVASVVYFSGAGEIFLPAQAVPDRLSRGVPTFKDA